MPQLREQECLQATGEEQSAASTRRDSCSRPTSQAEIEESTLRQLKVFAELQEKTKAMRRDRLPEFDSAVLMKYFSLLLFIVIVVAFGWNQILESSYNKRQPIPALEQAAQPADPASIPGSPARAIVPALEIAAPPGTTPVPGHAATDAPKGPELKIKLRGGEKSGLVRSHARTGESHPSLLRKLRTAAPHPSPAIQSLSARSSHPSGKSSDVQTGPGTIASLKYAPKVIRPSHKHPTLSKDDGLLGVRPDSAFDHKAATALDRLP